MKNRRKSLLPYISAGIIAVLLIIAAGAALAGCEQIGAGIDLSTDPARVEVGPSVPGGTPAKIPVATVIDSYASGILVSRNI